MLNNNGHKGHPCLTPESLLPYPVMILSISNFIILPLYILTIKSTRISCTPYPRITSNNFLLSTISYAFSISMKATNKHSFLTLTISSILSSINRLSSVVVVYPLPWPLLVGGVRCSRLWSTSQLLRPSGQQCSHSGGVCPQIQGRQCGAYVGAVEEMMCVVCVDVTEGA